MRTAYYLAAASIVAALLAWYSPSMRLESPLCAAEESTSGDNSAVRSRSGLLAMYDFRSSSGQLIEDKSGVGKPLNLRIADRQAVRRSRGALLIRGSVSIRSEEPASKITQAVRRTGEITIEAWIRPARTDQTGPARIVTLSQDPNQRNFTLGQDKDRFEVRLRTSETSANGIPAASSAPKSLLAKLTHVVYTRDRSGRTRTYVNGKQSTEQNIAGAMSNWNESYHLALANEVTNDRPWLGAIHLVAIYARELAVQEIRQNFRAGANALAQPALAQAEPARHFERQIAPLLARHCLECHDPVNKKGDLDLSRKKTALVGGESGKVLTPGKAAESLLWDYVESDEMPADRPPLSPQEKKLLREWIDSGAAWPLEVIDPVLYVHEGRAGKNFVRRLTAPEYIQTVRGAVGVDIAEDARRFLPPDLRADGFSNTAYNLNVDLKHVDAYSKLAEIIVERMDVASFARKYTKSRQLTDNNMRGLIAEMGAWLLRGPLEDHEVTAYRGISTTVASAGGDFDEAVGLIIEAMLQSPRFIYRIENQIGDGSAWPVGDYELASRLSYIIWGGPPDEELMKAAEEGQLDRGGVEKQVQRMLQDPRAIERSSQFVYEWLNLARLENMQPNGEKFPHWNEELAADMRDETLTFFRHIAWEEKRPLADLLNARVTFASPRLAKHYGLKSQGDGIQRYDVASVPGRGGLLTHASVLTVGGDDASMVSRGLFVLHDLLRGTVKDPPPCVDTTPTPTKPGRTQRAIAEARIANANCGGCHSKFEPLAFGLEKFDGLGAWHEQDEHGNKLRDDGQILFPGQAEPVAYDSSAELMDLLAGSERVRLCITWKIAQFALARPLTAVDAPVIEKIHQSAQMNGGTYASLIKAIVMSDLVQTTNTEASP